MCDFLCVQLPPSCSPQFSGCSSQNRPLFSSLFCGANCGRNCEMSVTPPKQFLIRSSTFSLPHTNYASASLTAFRKAELMRQSLCIPQFTECPEQFPKENTDMKSSFHSGNDSHFNSIQSRFRRHTSSFWCCRVKANAHNNDVFPQSALLYTRTETGVSSQTCGLTPIAVN